MRNLLLQALPILPAGLLSSAIALVDQFFCKKLGDQLFKIHLFYAYIPFVLVCFGRVLGTAIKIFSAKEYKQSRDVLYSSFYSSVNILFVFLLGLSVMSVLVHGVIIGHNTVKTSYGVLMAISGSLQAILSSYTFVFIAERKTSYILYINFLTFIINLFINTISLFFIDPHVRFLVIGFGSVLSVSFSILVQRKILIPTKALSRKGWRYFWGKAKKVILSELFFLLVTSIYPFIYALTLLFDGSTLGVEFNVIYRYQHFLSVPFIALHLVGTVSLGPAFSSGDFQSFNKKLQEYKYALYMVGLLVTCFGLIIGFTLEKKYLSLNAFFILLELVLFPHYFKDVSILRLAEKSSLLSKLNFVFLFMVSIPLALIGNLLSLNHSFVLISFFIPSLFKTLLVKHKAQKVLISGFGGQM